MLITATVYNGSQNYNRSRPLFCICFTIFSKLCERVQSGAKSQSQYPFYSHKNGGHKNNFYQIKFQTTWVKYPLGTLFSRNLATVFFGSFPKVVTTAPYTSTKISNTAYECNNELELSHRRTDANCIHQKENSPKPFNHRLTLKEKPKVKSDHIKRFLAH